MFGPKQEPFQLTTTIVWYSTNTSDVQGWGDATDAEDAIRHIVREELAELVPVDVPDAPPEDL